MATTASATTAVDPVQTISRCKQLIQWLCGTFPPRQATTFCPNNAAFDRFAVLSGFKTWADMWSAIQAAQAPWTPYLQRIASYWTVPGQYLSWDFLKVAGPKQHYDTSLTGSGLTVQPTASSAWLITPAVQRARIVLKAVVVGSIYNWALVHSTDAVLFPPDTHPTVARALSGQRTLSLTNLYGSALWRSMSGCASSTATLIVPDNSAWSEMQRFAAPLPAWLGGLQGPALVSAQMRAVLIKYFSIDLAAAGAQKAITREAMVDCFWKSGGVSLISLPTRLTVNQARQLMYFTYDPSTDGLYLLGSRNQQAAPYMAGAPVAKTVYAGCSTLLVVSSCCVPLPEYTGVARYDPAAAAER